jgi:hypothetical protein
VQNRSCLQYRIPIRGGSWNNGSDAGLFNLNLNNTRTNANNDIGFRVALILSRIFNFTKLEESNKQKEIKTLSISKRQKYSYSPMRLVTCRKDNIAWGSLL